LPEPPCAFCAIARGDEAGRVLYEDQRTVAFLDITRVAEGHTLVIPKRHAADLWEISDEDALAVMRTVRRLADRIRDVLRPDGLTLFQANGAAGWQDVFHLHVHLVPRTAGDQLNRPWVAAPVEPATLHRTRAMLAVTG
jgi:histidine triad (HIT) family protein